MEMSVKTHTPSHTLIRGNRVLISYEGQPTTSYGCNDPGHQNQDCPHRRPAILTHTEKPKNSWVRVVAQGNTVRRPDATNKNTPDVQDGPGDVILEEDSTVLYLKKK
jgi:hypothetical protein